MDEWHEQRRMCCSHPWPARSKYLNKKKKILSSPESPGVNSRGTVSDPGDNKSSPQGWWFFWQWIKLVDFLHQRQWPLSVQDGARRAKMRGETLAVEIYVKEMCGGRATATQRGWLCTTRAAKFTNSPQAGRLLMWKHEDRQEMRKHSWHFAHFSHSVSLSSPIRYNSGQ